MTLMYDFFLALCVFFGYINCQQKHEERQKDLSGRLVEVS